MRSRKREFFIGITALMLVFAIGWLVYSQVYANMYKKPDISAQGSVQKEKEDDKEKNSSDDGKQKPEKEGTEKEETEKVEEQKENVENENRQKTEESMEQKDNNSENEIKVPKNLFVLYSKKGAVISWKKVKGADSYIIYRKGKDGKLRQLTQTEENSYMDEAVEKKQAYRYRVCTVMKSGDEELKGELTKGVSYYHSEIDPNKPMVALTFDDGPSIYTEKILKTLKKYNARATFFIVGERASQYAETIKLASDQGCEIGSHSYSHANLGTSPVSTIKSQLNRTEKKVKDILGFYTPVMRPPYGSIGTALRKQVGKPMILWSIDTLDWKTRNAKSTVKRIMSTVEDGDIILMHDLYKESRDAAVQVIPKLIKKGYQLVTVSEMAQYKDIKMKAGKAYTDMK